VTIKAAIIDDERIIAADLAQQLARRPNWNIAGVFHDPEKLRQFAQTEHIDVCFLDIEMPGTDGLALARELKCFREDLLIVFVTAHAQFAATAFRMNAVDYLVKPAAPEVLEETCRRLEERLSQPLGRVPEKIAVVSSGKVDYIILRDVLAVKAAVNYVALVAKGGEFLHRSTFSSFIESLAPAGFLRTHRSYAVQPDAVVSAITRAGEIVELVLSTGARIPVSEAFRPSITAVLNSSVLS
jgi:DNA-binding LytR/AlgR family response regulator